jgi:hypothetical protein
MQHEFEPQLRGLVLHDEEQLIVMRRIAPQVLRCQQLIEVKVVGVAHRLPEIGMYSLLDGTETFAHAHLGSFTRWLDRIIFLTAVTIVK